MQTDVQRIDGGDARFYLGKVLQIGPMSDSTVASWASINSTQAIQH